MDFLNASAAFGRYLLTTGKSPETVRTYSSALSLFWRWCEVLEEHPPSADRDTVKAWLLHRSESVSSARVHSNLAALRIYYEHLIDEELRVDNPTRGIRWKRTESLGTIPLEREELVSLIKGCSNERDRLIVLLLVYSGVRITEFASMTAEEIDWAKGTITIRHGKGDVARQVAPAPEVMGRLHSYLGLMPEGPIWRSARHNTPMKSHQIRKRIYVVAKNAGVENVHPHRFRATFACEMIEQTGGDIQAVKGAMGHKTIVTTSAYAKSVELRRGLIKMQGLNLAV